MLRRLHTLAAFLATILLLAALALWARSRSRADVFILRTAPSYTDWPAVKWVVVRAHNGLVVSFHLKVVPSVAPGDPPWREDVPPGSVAPLSETHDAAVLKPVQPTGDPRARRLTEREHRAYERQAAPLYAARPRLQWQSRPPAMSAPPDGGNRILRAVGVWSYGPNDYVVDDADHPGAYRDVRVRVPYAGAAAAAAVIPLAWIALALRRRAARRRLLRQGRCPACGYDLRGSTGRCPECGRASVPGETDRARRGGLAALVPDSRAAFGRPRRATMVVTTVVLAALGTAAFVLRRAASTGPGPLTPEAVRLRHELDAQMDLVVAEVRRLREVGDAAAADALEAELRPLRERAAGAAPPAGDEPELHLVGVVTGYTPGAPPTPPTDPRLLGGAAPSWAAQDGPGPRPQGTAAVEVTATDRPVVLALCSNARVKWEVKLAPGVRLEKVVLGGDGRQEVTGVPPGVPVVNDPLSSFFAYRRQTTGYRTADIVLRKLTGLPVKTVQGQFRYTGQPFVVGPPNAAWEAQRLLADLRPLVERVRRSDHARFREALRPVRFTAVWHVPRGTPGPLGRALAEFDLDGPLRSTLRPLTPYATCATIDPARSTCYVAGHGHLARIDPATKRVVPVPPDPSARALGTVAGMAFDSRRRRLMALNVASTSAYFYTPDDGQWRLAGGVSRESRIFSLTYSDTDDCYYGLGRAMAGSGRVLAITRISAGGVAEWSVPVPGMVFDNYRRDLTWPPQIATAGRQLAIVTPPLPDPQNPDAPQQPRCVLIDPATNTVVYDGPIAPHD